MENKLAAGYFPLFLFPPISWWKKAGRHSKVVVVMNENWVKQSYRNRIEIYGPNNRQRLTFPIVGESKRGDISGVRLDNSHNWGIQNWRSLVTAYNKSPFFEYYSHDIEALFIEEHEHLAELNKKALILCLEMLNLDFEPQFESVDFATSEPNYCGFDFRKVESQEPYYQVFSDRNGFQKNLSVLDLLFNLGPEASVYFQSN